MKSVRFALAAFRDTVASVLIAGAAALAPSAQAAPLTFNFNGTVTSVTSDGSGLFGSTFATGQAVQGSWTFDSGAAGTPSALGYVTSYAATFSVTIGGQAFGGDIEYRIFDNSGAGGDGFSIVNEDANYTVPPGLSPLVASTFFLQMLGMPSGTLTGQGLVTDPVSIWSLADPTYAPNGLRLNNPNDGSFGLLYFSVSDVTSAVPEPGTVPLVCVSLLALGIAARRRDARSLQQLCD